MQKKKSEEKKRPPINQKTKNILWSKAAGMCQFQNCNKVLNVDKITKTDSNSAYIAHIYGYAKGSERYDAVLSPRLETDINNLMLLCDECHRRVDERNLGEVNYPASMLIEMKKKHENRINTVICIAPNMDSHIVIYKANIGEHSPVITYESVREYLLPDNYPALNRSINLGLENSPQRDKDSKFWETETDVLVENFNQNIRPLIQNSTINHISLFALAPMPLLIKLGTLLNDIRNLEVHQPIRNPKTWNLNDEDLSTDYKILILDKKQSKVALNISISGTINNERITDVLGEDVSIYTLTIQNPFNDFLKSKKQLVDFTIVIRKLFDQIKLKYGSNTQLHVFPAIPVAIAVELGRYWMPKADMPLIIYDENKLNDGFKKAIEIN
ncbi:SAVED domain-containing protein [Flavobacterium silvisoli]|uniref:SAVED domain-containing protein n=1 Tax=Flavobacterium silvisoli TaxID=2529433 RepID=A0A4Q9YYI7_9FLAO|nr:SAVED domain-containing protein [Flavobacterium silvisoli]TBX68727.1 SAVED domain-containing protein [Flavobacterium silvisoli]